MVDETMTKEVVVGNPKERVPLPFGIYCSGCHYGSIVRIICEVLEELNLGDRAVGLAGVGCSFGSYNIFINIDFVSCPHGRAPAMATAMKRIYPENFVFTVQGDGDLGAIGLGCWMNALNRGELLSTVFLNNACYGTTGGQMAPTTLWGQKTTTSAQGRNPIGTGFPFHGAELAASMPAVAYSARVSLHTPKNYREAKKAVKAAFEKQAKGIGYGFVELLSACPTNWKMSPVECCQWIEDTMIKEYPLGVFKDVDKIPLPQDWR